MPPSTSRLMLNVPSTQEVCNGCFVKYFHGLRRVKGYKMYGWRIHSDSNDAAIVLAVLCVTSPYQYRYAGSLSKCVESGREWGKGQEHLSSVHLHVSEPV